jgi:hypothetical protein
MKKMFNYLVILTIFCYLISSCKNHNQSDYENHITFDSIEVNRNYFMQGDSLNPQCNIDVKYIYPSDYGDDNTLRTLQKQFIIDFFGENYAEETTNDAADHYVQNYIADYKMLEKDFAKDFAEDPVRTLSYNYYESTHNEIKYNKFNIISYRVVKNYYTGGAHGNNGYDNHVIDLESRNKLDEKDIFIDNYQETLAKVLIETLLFDYKVTNEEKLEEVGFFNVKEIVPNNNFYIDDENITYTYNEYEIAPYSMGKIDVKIPYGKIKKILRNGSPIMRIKSGK